jgi:hypothetical protein
MPLPLLIIVPAIGAGLFGLYKGGKAISDNSDASDKNSSASQIVSDFQDKLGKSNAYTSALLSSYGERKIKSYAGGIKDFVGIFEQLKNVELTTSIDSTDLHLPPFNETFTALKAEWSSLQSAGIGLGAGLSSGAAAAYGAYSATMLFATAGTGTAISTLGGVAATNATLAWLGGGAIASGGGGMAAGAMVLGGLVAGPALAIAGFVMGAKAEESLNNAKANLAEAKVFREKAQLDLDMLQALQEIVRLASGTLSKLNSRLRKANNEMGDVVKAHGVDFFAYSDVAKNTVFNAVKLVQLVKALVDTAILDKQGNLIASTAHIEGIVAAHAS